MSEFTPVIIEFSDKLENPGDSMPVKGSLQVESFTVGEKEFILADGISYDVVLTNAGDGILVSGIVRASASGSCDRCLESASFDIAGEIEEYYLFEEPQDTEEYEDGYELVGEDNVVDLSDAINDAVVMETPFIVLCREDCLGLCPVCGANLNDGDCGCSEKAEQDWVDSDENPFAALKNLKFD